MSNSSSLAELIIRLDHQWCALGNEVFEADGATFVRNGVIPGKYHANHVSHITASTSAEIDRLVARVEREYDGWPQRCYYVDHTTPPEFEAWLALQGYDCDVSLTMVLTGDLVGSPKRHDIRPIDSDADWETYRSLLRASEEDGPEQRTLTEPEETARLTALKAKCPPLQYWMAYVDGEPAAFFGAFPEMDGGGQIDDLFTHPRFRRRGLATALIHHAVEHCRQQGAGPVFIEAAVNDTPKHMYRAMGFEPLMVAREYVKEVPTNEG